MALYEVEEFREYITDDGIVEIDEKIKSMSDEEVRELVDEYIDWELISHIVSDAYAQAQSDLARLILGP